MSNRKCTGGVVFSTCDQERACNGLPTRNPWLVACSRRDSIRSYLPAPSKFSEGQDASGALRSRSIGKENLHRNPSHWKSSVHFPSKSDFAIHSITVLPKPTRWGF